MAVIRDVMPAFELYQPSSVADAQNLLEQHGPDAWVLAGGLDSFDWLKDRIRKPKVVVELSGIEELRGVRTTSDGAFHQISHQRDFVGIELQRNR
ncbi:MAG: FAD binding domain-containing protein, partial [Terriglobales bacterium]